MSVTNTWVIEQMDCYPQAEGQTDVVFNADWRVIATDGTYQARSNGSQPITYKAGTPFTPYGALTQDQVVGWVQTAMGYKEVNAIQDRLAVEIQNQSTPPVVTPPLPWGKS